WSLFAAMVVILYLTHVVSVSPPPLMEVHSGENVTLQCINVLKKHGQVGWFKQVNSTEPLCITSMWSSLPAVHHQNGFQVKHMKMFMTNGTIFLKITEVDVADSGLYFCGMSDNYFIFTNATVLKVQGNLFNKLSAMTLNAQTFILGKCYLFSEIILKIQTIQEQERRREKDLDPHVLYAVTR
uniref:Ig-like domain-containing protein n=1 Tax=Hucho hucho TaxID=62062 RepID=A0A4W5KNM7_9TELE